MWVYTHEKELRTHMSGCKVSDRPFDIFLMNYLRDPGKQRRVQTVQFDQVRMAEGKLVEVGDW